MPPAGDWLSDRPPETIEAGSVVLERARALHRSGLVAAVNASLDELRPWMPWAQVPATDESIRSFLSEADRSWYDAREFQFALRLGPGGRSPGELIGCCGLHTTLGPGALEIGYWVHSDHTGRGVATWAARALTRSALALGTVDRVEIHCDESNRPSAAVAVRLGYRLERVEPKEPTAPGETGRSMVWVQAIEGPVSRSSAGR